MTPKEYRKYTAAALTGRRARLLEPVRNSLAGLDKGTVVTITGKTGGLNIESDKCAHCSVEVYVRGVDPRSLELLPR